MARQLKILSDIEELYDLKQKGTISQDEYVSAKHQILDALFQRKNMPLDYVEQGHQLFKSGALTKTEFQHLKNQVLFGAVSSHQEPLEQSQDGNAQKQAHKNKNLSLVWYGIFMLLISALKIFFYILSIPFRIIAVFLGWHIKEDIIAQGVKKASKNRY